MLVFMKSYSALKAVSIQYFKWLLAAILPPSCPVCRVSLPSETQGISICSDCWVDLPYIKEGETVLPDPRHMEYIDIFACPFLYDEPIKGLIHKLKYEDTPELSASLSVFMVQEVKKYILSRYSNDDILVLAVPMNKKRLLKRQFNQADLLAKCLAKELKLSYQSECLRRPKSTSQQQGKTRKQRQSNLKGAFDVDKAQVQGKDIILIDDVWTTGSTASACAKVLKNAGASSVNVVTLCYVEK